MKPLIIILALFLLSVGKLNAQLTIEDCVTQAEANYPLIKKFNLNEATARIDLSDINRSWLPRISAYTQATVQNVVPSFPSALKSALDQMGQEMRGLGKLQYKFGVDVSQMIYDGGASKARRDIIRTQKDLKRASLEVEMYAVRERVENLFFAILLCDEQIAQNEITRTLLQSNVDRLRSMLSNGTAMQSDLDMVEAQLLTVDQHIIQAQSAVKGYKEVLALYIGEKPESIKLIWPEEDEMPLTNRSDRPELRLFNLQLAANEASDRLTNTTLLPKIGFFAQAYYGYPGIDYFQSMINRDLSFNLLAGVKVSWYIDSFY
ncbi:MAG: TolC family protein, partial [Paramuribaculum sp.]|nr:TolC family protein [Paramuribaculum sp.]